MGYPTSAPAFPPPGTTGSMLHGVSPDGHPGPSTYVQSATTGDPLQAVEFGFMYLVRASAGLTSDGLYNVTPVNPTAGPVTSLKLVWTDPTTGIEVPAGTDLSGSRVNIDALGL